MPSLRTVFRLSKITLINLFEQNARCVDPVRTINAKSGLVHAALEWHRRSIVVRGKSVAGGLTVAFDNRAGVALGGEFDLQLQRPDRRSGITFAVTADDSDTVMHFPAPGPIKIARALLTAIPSAFQTILHASSDIITFLRTGDAATAGRLRRTFGITPVEDTACSLPCDLLGAYAPSQGPADDVTIIVPIYNAADELKRLFSRLDSSLCSILLVDDGSDDPLISQLLTDFVASQENAVVISFSENRGFVHAVNTALERCEGHVILLNSDALPPAGNWIARLIAPILSDPKIATVTPFSNNAEIISIPQSGHHSDISTALVDEIDQTAKCIGTHHAQVELPTGIGFCMAMNRAFIDAIGGFDPVFGRGYGEEVDWCRKAVASGGRNVGLASLFVGHEGGASFGAEKALRIQTATDIIRLRYPDFDHDVRAWAQKAPAQAQTLALSLAWLSAISDTPVPIFVGHSMGGGAETALCNEIETALRTSKGVVVLRVGGPALWRIELRTRDFSKTGDAMYKATVLALLSAITDRQLIYSCGVGGRHPLDAPNLLVGLINERSTLVIHVHDFFPISPSWNLLDASGRFQGVPDMHSTDTAHSISAMNGQKVVPHRHWRDTWGKLFALADKIITFSKASRSLVCEAYPDIANKTVVRPHELSGLPGVLAEGGKTIGVLGSLNRAKGAEVVQRLACVDPGGRRFVVIGELDGQYALPKPHIVHGRYERSKISELAQSYDVGLWLIPSICPETFSFAAHEALATGLPVMAFARGAQGDAVIVAKNGYVLDCDPDDTKALVAAIDRISSFTD